MISNPTQCATARSYADGSGLTGHTTQLTGEYIDDYPAGLTEANLGTGYIMYYVPWEKIPPVYKSSACYSDANNMVIRCQTEPQNAPGLFLASGAGVPGNGTGYVYHTDYVFKNGSLVNTNVSGWQYSGWWRQYSWVNNHVIRRSAVDLQTAYSKEIMFFVMAIDKNTRRTAGRVESFSNVSPSLSNNLTKFILGQVNFTFTIGSGDGIFANMAYEGETLTLSAAELENENGFKKIDFHGYDLIIGIPTYAFYFYNDLKSDNTNGAYLCITPSLILNENNHKHVRVISSSTGTRPETNQADWYDDYYALRTNNVIGGLGYTTGDIVNGDDAIIGDYNLTVSKSDFTSAPEDTIWINGTTIGIKYSSEYLKLYRLYKPSEIILHMQLFPAVTTNGANFYGLGDTKLVPHFNENDEFLGEFLQGSFAEIAGKLRPWQYDYYQLNEMTIEDVPEYNPEPGDVPDAYGSNVLPDLNLQIGTIGGFITQYCMTAAQVSSFGSYLWANIFSTDFLHSVGTMIANDFSINPSDILKYIVSLRCYPFDLANVSGFNSNPDTIYFGRGVVGIPSAGIGTMDNLVTTFGGENINVPRLYNDFRDYEPYTRISLNIPFCGQVELTPSEVAGKNIFITYTVDFSAGTVQANVWVNSDIAFIVASASGSIGANIQISASNGMEFLQKIGSTVASFVKTVGTVAAIAATAGAASEAIGVEASEPFLSQAEFSALQSKSTANAVQAGAGISEALVSSPEASSLPVHSKSVGGGFTSFSTPRAYLIVEQRKYVIPSNYDHVYGKACNFTTTLNSVRGFTVCRNVDLNGIPATQEELSAIESLLTSGVYF